LESAANPIDDSVLELLICPVTGSSLSLEGDFLVSECGEHRYPIKNGIAVLVRQASDSSAQEPDAVATGDP
jgi:uncharacterized protein YbaR (Trm112 family)